MVINSKLTTTMSFTAWTAVTALNNPLVAVLLHLIRAIHRTVDVVLVIVPARLGVAAPKIQVLHNGPVLLLKRLNLLLQSLTTPLNLLLPSEKATDLIPVTPLSLAPKVLRVVVLVVRLTQIPMSILPLILEVNPPMPKRTLAKDFISNKASVIVSTEVTDT